MANACQLEKRNLGLGSCPSMPAYFKSMFWTPLNWFIPAATIAQGNAAVLAFLQSALVANKGVRIHKFPTFFSNTDQSDATVYQKTVLGQRAVAPGFYSWLINFSDSLCSHKALRTFKTNTGRIIFLDTQGQLIGTDPNDNGDFYGQTIQMLNPEKMKMNTGIEVAMSPITLVLEDNLELDDNGAILSVAGISSLLELTDAALVLNDATDADMVVAVNIACDGTPISGLEEGDFVVLNSSGVPVTITGVTEENGVYTLTGTFATGDTVNLVAAADLSVEGYESLAAIPVVIHS